MYTPIVLIQNECKGKTGNIQMIYLIFPGMTMTNFIGPVTAAAASLTMPAPPTTVNPSSGSASTAAAPAQQTTVASWSAPTAAMTA